jgi:hypothetical protein
MPGPPAAAARPPARSCPPPPPSPPAHAAAGLIVPSWKKRYPNNATVCETTVAMVVRAGNPKNISTWEDLLRDDVEVGRLAPDAWCTASWCPATWRHLHCQLAACRLAPGATWCLAPPGAWRLMPGRAGQRGQPAAGASPAPHQRPVNATCRSSSPTPRPPAWRAGSSWRCGACAWPRATPPPSSAPLGPAPRCRHPRPPLAMQPRGGRPAGRPPLGGVVLPLALEVQLGSAGLPSCPHLLPLLPLKLPLLPLLPPSPPGT